MPAQYIDTRDANRAVRDIARSMSPQQVAKATARAINHTLAKARTPAKRDILKRYTLHKSQVESKALRTKPATVRTLTGGIQASNRPLPLLAFPGTTQTKTGTAVTIIQGQRKRIRSAFIITTKKGRRGVFARGTHDKAGNFTFRKKRLVKSGPDLPIQELFTVSIYKAGLSRPVQETVKRIASSQYAPRLVHELHVIASGITR